MEIEEEKRCSKDLTEMRALLGLTWWDKGLNVCYEILFGPEIGRSPISIKNGPEGPDYERKLPFCHWRRLSVVVAIYLFYWGNRGK